MVHWKKIKLQLNSKDSNDSNRKTSGQFNLESVDREYIGTRYIKKSLMINKVYGDCSSKNKWISWDY